MLGTIPKLPLWQRYTPIPAGSNSWKEEANDVNISELLPVHPDSPSLWRGWLAALVPWALTVFFASFALYQWLLLSPAQGTYADGWRTEFSSISDAIKVEAVRFDGGAAFSKTGKYSMKWGDVRYFGVPSEEIDRAWEELIWGRYILLTEDEARDAFSADYGDDISALWSPRHGGYYSGFSMFHTLHCLNRLRKAFEPNYYTEDDPDNMDHVIHRDHCLEQLRQYIVCAGDLTPVPTVYNEGKDSSYIDSNLQHTCRNYEAIHDWVTERYNGSTAVPPKCPHGTYHRMGKLMCIGH